jgi:hypothetical protein
MPLSVWTRRVAIGLALLGSGCIPMGRSATSTVASAGSSLPVVVSTALSETRTLSFALDRIDQHELR